jgi:predicted enzyme related to lactoylglutathione lyase
MRASVGHFEIPVKDMERAAEFYRRVFGWKVEALPWGGPAYSKIRPAVLGEAEEVGELGGGLMEASALGSPHPLLVIHLWEGSMEECLSRIIEAGGRMEKAPSQIGEMGTFARFRDPEGNLLGLWRGCGDETPQN